MESIIDHGGRDGASSTSGNHGDSQSNMISTFDFVAEKEKKKKRGLGGIFHLHSTSTPNLKQYMQPNGGKGGSIPGVPGTSGKGSTPTSPNHNNQNNGNGNGLTSSSSTVPLSNSQSSLASSTSSTGRENSISHSSSLSSGHLMLNQSDSSVSIIGNGNNSNSSNHNITITPPSSPRGNNSHVSPISMDSPNLNNSSGSINNNGVSPTISPNNNATGNNSNAKGKKKFMQVIRRVKSNNKLKKEIADLSLKTGLTQQYNADNLPFNSYSQKSLHSNSSPNLGGRGSQRRSRFIESPANSTDDYSDIPKIFKLSIEYLYERALKVPGIFRESANAMELQRLKQIMESDQEINLTYYHEPHNIGGLLKLYLRERPTPLFPYDLHKSIITLYEQQKTVDEELCIKVKDLMVKELSKGHYLILRYLFELLHAIHLNAEVNNMHAYNLAVCFAPSLIHSFDCSCIEVVSKLIEDYEIVFGIEVVPISRSPNRSPSGSPSSQRKSVRILNGSPSPKLKKRGSTLLRPSSKTFQSSPVLRERVGGSNNSISSGNGLDYQDVEVPPSLQINNNDNSNDMDATTTTTTTSSTAINTSSIKSSSHLNQSTSSMTHEDTSEIEEEEEELVITTPTRKSMMIQASLIRNSSRKSLASSTSSMEDNQQQNSVDEITDQSSDSNSVLSKSIDNSSPLASSTSSASASIHQQQQKEEESYKPPPNVKNMVKDINTTHPNSKPMLTLPPSNTSSHSRTTSTVSHKSTSSTTYSTGLKHYNIPSSSSTTTSSSTVKSSTSSTVKPSFVSTSTSNLSNATTTSTTSNNSGYKKKQSPTYMRRPTLNIASRSITSPSLSYNKAPSFNQPSGGGVSKLSKQFGGGSGSGHGGGVESSNHDSVRNLKSMFEDKDKSK